MTRTALPKTPKICAAFPSQPLGDPRGPYTACVINSRRISVVLPAYNAEATLSRTVAELDRDVIDEVVLVDDASSDQTVSLARELGLDADLP